MRPDFDAALPDPFAEDFDFEDFEGEVREVFDAGFFVEVFLLGDFDEDLREAAARVGAAVFVARGAAFAVREAALGVRAATLRAAFETALSLAVFAPEGPSVEGLGRSMSPAVGLTAPTASAAVSSAAFASPAACSPACPISLEAASTAPPRTPRATSSAPPTLFFLAI